MTFFTRLLTGSLLGAFAGAALVRRSRRRMRFFSRRPYKDLRRMVTRAEGVWRLFRGGRLLR